MWPRESPVADAHGSPVPVWRQPPNVLSVLLVVLLAANYFSPFGDLDYTWQIRTGEQIVREGRLRTADEFSYTIAGKVVADFEWLYEVVLWTVWNSFGYGGLKLLKTVLVAAPLLLVSRRLHAEGVGRHGILAALFVALAVLIPAWNLRPMYCTTIGLLLVAGWLHDHCTGRRRLDWRLPLVMLVWANTHPGVIVGQGLVAGAIGWEWLNRRLRLNPPLDAPACWRLTLLGGLGLVATLASPDPVDRLLYPFRPELAHPIHRAFTEMQPLYTFVARWPCTAGLVYVVAALVGLTVVLRFRAYRLWELALLGGLTLLGNVAFRGVQDWLLVMLALGLPHLAVLLRAAVRARRRRPVLARLLELDWLARRGLRGPLLRLQWFWPTAAFGLLAAASLVPPISRRMPRQDAAAWPVAALDRAVTLGLAGRFFGPPDFGAYVGWRLGDRGRCYVDTRGFFFPPELLEDSICLPQLPSDWPVRLERVLDHGTDFFLLETTGPRGRLWEALRPHAGEPVYHDTGTVLLSAEQVRRSVALAHPLSGEPEATASAARSLPAPR